MQSVATRRAFFGDLGQGLLLASLGPAILDDIGFRSRLRCRPDDRLDFGALEPLVRMMQETPAGGVMEAAMAKLREGVALKTLAAAAALANARTFGGTEYTGFHCAMAIAPAFDMSAQMKDQRLAALPLLKVIRRNTAQIGANGGREKEVLRKLGPHEASNAGADALIAAERGHDSAAAESCLAAAARATPSNAFEILQPLVRENIDVHQVVLAWRAWDLQRLAGRENAVVLLRQSVRHCVDTERSRVRDRRRAPAIRSLLPALLAEHKLLEKTPPERTCDDAEIAALADEIFACTGEDAARAAAAALAAGARQGDVAEAVSLAAFRLLLHDPGRRDAERGRPKGSVHGASVGVHASDSAHAWRNIAAITSRPTAVATLIASAWHTGGQSGGMDKRQPFHAAVREDAGKTPPEKLIDAIQEAVRGRDQRAAAALVERYGTLNLPADALLAELIGFSVQDDGALHHEKFFRTACEHFAGARPAFRWTALAALARVCASGAGHPAAGVDDARARLLA